MPRIALNNDLYKTGFSKKDDFSQTTLDIQNLINEKGIKQEDARNKVAWFTGYTPEIVDNISFEQVVEKEYKDIEYLLWPYWNIGSVYTRKSVDKETHLQRAFINTYADNIEYRFPTFLAKYMHKVKKFAWDKLGITWNPELDSLVESQYAVIKLKRPIDALELRYTLGFRDISHYTSPYSRVFNLKNLNDSYMFAPCYTYDAVKFIHSGEWVEPPPEIGVRARTAGLYCHSVRFRVLPKGVYFIRVSGLPENTNLDQKVYYNLGDFNWDTNTKTANFVVGQTFIPGEFGIATKEAWISDLKFEILYILNDEIINAIDTAIKENQEQSSP
ncbi:MAG: hypothetical protein ABIB98_03585 [bacterium]